MKILKDKSHVIFLLDSISQPRCIRRVKSFINKGYVVEVYGINRNKYNINAEIEGVNIKIIGDQHSGKGYITKIIENNSEIRKILRDKQGKEVLYYSFGFPLTFSLFLNGNRNYVYEIADILYGFKKHNFARWFLKLIDRSIIKNSRLTVLTSKGFLSFLYDKHPDNIIIQPNKLDPYFKKIERKNFQFKQNIDKLIFAFVGSFRSPNTIFRFAEVIGMHFLNYEFHFHGDSKYTPHVLSLINKYNNIKYFGPYKNPEDLTKIYETIDIVVACYDTSNFNERILEPNKLYESIFFKKPIVVSDNTYIASQVEKLKIGFSINPRQNENIIAFINSLTKDLLIEMSQNCNLYKSDDLIDDNGEAIISKLNE